MTTTTSLKGHAMRLAADLSNINDFAYFVGGQIVTRTRGDGLPSVAISEDQYDSYVHGGYYAIATEHDVKRWYGYDFEEMFDVPEDIESIPEGWSAYPEGSDLSKYGKVVTEFTREEGVELIRLVRNAKEAGKLTRKRNLKKLHKSELFRKFSKSVNCTHELVPLDIAALVFSFSNVRSATTPAGKTIAVFSYDDYSKYAVVTGFSVSTDKVQRHLNRSILTKP